MDGSPGELSEELVTQEKRKKGWRINCDGGEATDGLKNELWCRWSDGKLGEWAELILQAFCHFTYVIGHSPKQIALLILQVFRDFTYVIGHSPTLPSLYLRHSSFFNPSVALPMSQLILQPFFRFSYITGSSLTSPGKPPMSLDTNISLNIYHLYVGQCLIISI